MQNTAILGGCYDLLDPFSDSTDFIFKLYDNDAMKRWYFIPFRILRFFHIIKDIPLTLKMFTGNWMKHCATFDNWIVIYGKVNYSGFVRYVKKRNPKAKFFFYSWDIQYSFNDKNNVRKLGAVGNFDEKLAMLQKTNFWGQFYNTNHINSNFIGNNADIYSANGKDFIFLGQNKNRKIILEELEKTLNSEGLYGVIDIACKNKIPYKDYFNQIKNFNSIIDIVTPGQSGLTWRVMESVFCDKKLITNNTSIIKYDFYHPSNIYIIGKDKRSFSDFFKSKYQIIDQKIKEKYTIESWINKVISSNQNIND